jgi:HEAT repeat protein
MEETNYDYSSLKKAIESKLRKALDAKKNLETSKSVMAVPHKLQPKIGFLDGKTVNLPSTLSKTVDLSSGNLPGNNMDHVNWFDVLKKSTSYEERKEAIRGISKLSSPAVVNTLLDVLLKDEHKDLRLEAAEALVKLKDKRVLDGLMKGMKLEKDYEVRKRIAWAYSQIKYK